MVYSSCMKKPRCTGKNKNGHACMKPADMRILLPGLRVGFRCDEHPVPADVVDDGTVKVFRLKVAA